MNIVNVVGARPNFMKIAPIHRRMQASSRLQPVLIHTGQHYDEKMSQTFFSELGMPEPDLYLGVGSGSHARQTAAVMTAIEEVLLNDPPDWIVVVGDVNSTLAASLVASKLCIPVAHVEAGLRSQDRSMPEEINRVVTDSISDLLFVSEPSGLKHLKEEGVADEKIHFVGNVMIDSLVEHQKMAKRSTILDRLGLGSDDYVLMTLHRPSNVDEKTVLNSILDAVQEIQTELPVIFPMHPRTARRLAEFGLDNKVTKPSGIITTDPLGYLDFTHLMKQAALVLTDSGGIQEETTFFGVPCITLRLNTERPVTLTEGTNRLVALDTRAILDAFHDVRRGGAESHRIPALWDGEASKRIVDIFEQIAH